MSTYVLSYDIGTTGIKTCLFEIDQTISMIDSASCGYHLYILDNGGAEKDADEWWEAMCRTTKEVFDRVSVSPDQVAGISFCSQMQGLVLVDRDGVPVHRPMSYMDQRAEEELRAGVIYGISFRPGCSRRGKAAQAASPGPGDGGRSCPRRRAGGRQAP